MGTGPPGPCGARACCACCCAVGHVAADARSTGGGVEGEGEADVEAGWAPMGPAIAPAG